MLKKVHIISSEKISMKNKVKLLTGGKEMYEPVFLKYLAPEILTAALVGSKYSAPSPDEIYSILKYLSNDHRCGIIVIIPNDLDEVINFKLGVEKAKDNNISIEMIAVSDNCWDISEKRRPSLAGLCFVYQLAGVMNAFSIETNEIYEILNKLRMKTVSCRMKKYFSFVGTHFEIGAGKFTNTSNLSDLIRIMLDRIFIEMNSSFQSNHKSFIILINCHINDRIFLNSCGNEILKQIESRQVDITKVYLGNFLFGPKGFSITFIEKINERLFEIVDATYSNHIWPRKECILRISDITLSKPFGPFIANTDFIKIPLSLSTSMYSACNSQEMSKVIPKIWPRTTTETTISDERMQRNNANASLEMMFGLLFVELTVGQEELLKRFSCEAMMSSKGIFNRLDVNNNFGTSVFHVLDILLTQFTKKEICLDRPYKLFTTIALIFQEVMKDTYGNLFHILFSGIAEAFSHYFQDVPVIRMMWIESLDYAINFVKENAGETEGNLTFIDVLSPFVSILEHHLSYFDRDLNETLGEVLHETNTILETSYSIESNKKRKGHPEVSTQATFVALTAIIQGIRVVMNSTRSQNN